MNDIEKAMAAARQARQRASKAQTTVSKQDFNEPAEYLTDKVTEWVGEVGEATDLDVIRNQLAGRVDVSLTEGMPSEVEGNSDLSLQNTASSDERVMQLDKTKIKYSKLHELPLASLGKLGFITPSTPKNQITEEYRRIKRPLLKRLGRSNDDSEGLNNVLAVTSAMSGEGKTYSAINLAMSLAREKDRTVLLIDSDVVRHTAGELFRVPSNSPGLLDLLDDDTVEPSDVILRTNVERLSFLPAGRKNALASELLSSDTMMKLIADLSNRYPERIIVMDCPPIMQTTEAAILVDHAGQIVFVVSEEQTRQGVVVQALRLIDNEKKVGVLLNKSTTRFGHYDYYNYSYS